MIKVIDNFLPKTYVNDIEKLFLKPTTQQHTPHHPHHTTKSPSISASASIAFRWAVGFAFYAMERHHDPRTEAVGARRCRLGHMLRRFQPLFCGRRHAQPFLCVGERAGGRARGYRGRHAAQKASPSTPRRALAADSSYQLPLLQDMRCRWLAPAAKTGFAALSHGAFFSSQVPPPPQGRCRGVGFDVGWPGPASPAAPAWKCAKTGKGKAKTDLCSLFANITAATVGDRPAGGRCNAAPRQ